MHYNIHARCRRADRRRNTAIRRLYGEPGSNRADLRELVGGATQDANADSPNQAEQACFIPPIPPQILPSKKQRIKYATAEGLEYEVGRTGLTMASDAGRVAAADAAGGGDEWGARRELGRWGRECARRDGDWGV